MISLALYQPEIPHNTGALIRLSACYGMTLHIIEPTGFIWSDRHLIRSGLDYQELAQVQRHQDFDHFYQQPSHQRIVLADVNGEHNCYDFTYTNNDIILMGRESNGVPREVFDLCHERVYIPMAANARSLNMAMAAAILTSDARRQLLYAN